jgi:hypothetical protein
MSTYKTARWDARTALLAIAVLIGLPIPTLANIGTLTLKSKTDTSASIMTTLDSSWELVDQNIHRPFRIKWVPSINLGSVPGGTRMEENPDFTIGSLKPAKSYLISVEAYTRRKGAWISFKQYRTVGTLFVTTNPASSSYCPPASWFNGPLSAYYDGANCFVTKVPAGGSPFIYSGNYYITAQQGASCPISLCKCPAGNFDGANCYIVSKPPNGFIWQNGFYQKPGPSNSCPQGWTFDTANCFLMKAPWGTTAFEYQGAFYTTKLPYCSTGSFDGANCYLGKPPAGRKPFIYQGGFYYE